MLPFGDAVSGWNVADSRPILSWFPHHGENS